MTLSVADIERWDPEAVREVFHAASARSGASTDAARASEQLPAFECWGGVTADAARDAIHRTRVDLDTHAREALAVAQAAQKAAQDIEKVKIELRDLKDDARSQGLDVDPATSTVVKGPGFKGTPAELATKIADLQTRLNAIIAEANGVDAELAAAINMADGKLPMPDTQPTPAPPSESTPPEDVKKWWDSLTPEQQQAELRDNPPYLGNLNGIPVEARDQANQTAMRTDIENIEEAASRHGVSAQDVLDNPFRYGCTPDDVMRYTNAVKVQDALEHDSLQTGAHTYLQVYQPTKFDGQGRAAIAIGNPDKAANTTVVVPGTSHSVTEGWLSADDATNLYIEAKAADPTTATSVVAWMGYNAPDDLTDPQVAQTSLAHEGGALLAADVNGLNATHGPGLSHITVMGHSYGSTTVADAAAGYGMHSGDVILIGSPGTDMARSANDFHLAPGGHVFVGAASTDPITQLGVLPQVHVPATGVTLALGADPAMDGFGSTRFKAEVPGWTINDHSHYFDPGTESLFSMADIVSGQGDALEVDGMTAPHRADNILTDIGVLPSDPELYRAPTSGHYH
ncbi:alpha/beta hydrolase [Mycolicibacterium sp. P1-5]|uniref:alpha/beta hydrolase n=1 Tax=Mycolicibacterium sp. P1-5 TaxID=2024617 RepID=UPI001D154154|nr:alpha/beta hydrolase [Mycolicibacterium sp. P1-5]